MNEYGIILFDLDGTLTDSREGIIRSAEYALRELGQPVPGNDKMKLMLGPPLIVSMRELFGMPEELAQQAVKKYRERYSTVGLFENRPYDGVKDMLKELKAAGRRLAVATSKPEVFSVRILEKFGLAGYFENITGSGLDGSRDTKREVIEEALSRLGVRDRSKAIMVGDRSHDIIGAREAGIPCIGAGWGYAPEGELNENGAAVIASSPGELLMLLTGRK
ncbi:MAG: HAD family hydrolase [Ruminococcus sp.]|nr:HAD family hydrolase [Ruminococcus sp.]